MKRIILNTSKKIADAYIISDKYIRLCNGIKRSNDSSFLNFLESADYLQILLDKTDDIFNNSSIEHYETIRRHGSWFWSSDLNFYSNNHYFVWPSDFIEFYNLNGKTTFNEDDNGDRKVIDLFYKMSGNPLAQSIETMQINTIELDSLLR